MFKKIRLLFEKENQFVRFFVTKRPSPGDKLFMIIGNTVEGIEFEELGEFLSIEKSKDSIKYVFELKIGTEKETGKLTPW